MKHDALVRALRAVATATDLRKAAGAWLASLGSAPVRGRTPLPHLAYASNMPEHRFVASTGEQSYMCAICGESASIEIDRADILSSITKKGDAIIASPSSALVDLEAFASEPAIAPTAEDIARFNAMLDVVARLPASGRATDLVKRFGAIVPKTNAYSRAALVPVEHPRPTFARSRRETSSTCSRRSA